MKKFTSMSIGILISALALVTPSALQAQNAKTEPKPAAQKAATPKVVKKVKYRKTQEVSFDGDDVEGVARNPYGAYLTQKRGIDFAPLYKVRERFDENIKDSVQYLRVQK